MSNQIKYQQFCPVAITAEIICNRWTPLILRAFFCGAKTFSDIQKSAPLMPPATLSSRLKGLQDANIVEKIDVSGASSREYQLTPAGKALFPIMDQMGNWAQDWLRREITLEENLDPDVLFWELRQLTVSRDEPISMRRVAKFQVHGVPTQNRSYWLVFDPMDTEICLKDPGHEVDLWITAHIRTLVEIWLGHITLQSARESGALQLEGSPSEIAAFSKWFILSHFSKMALGAPHSE